LHLKSRSLSEQFNTSPKFINYLIRGCIKEKMNLNEDFLINYNFEEYILRPLALHGFEAIKFREFQVKLENSPSLSHFKDPKIVDKIIKFIFNKHEQCLLRSHKRSSAVKFALTVLLLLHFILREERINNQKWETQFNHIVLPALALSKQAKIKDASPEEMSLLVAFYRAMVYLKDLMPAKQNKNLFIKVAAKLEGSDITYVTGGNNSPQTQRRVVIFELVTNVKPRNRDNTKPRKPKHSTGPRTPGVQRRRRSNSGSFSLESSCATSSADSADSRTTATSSAAAIFSNDDGLQYNFLDLGLFDSDSEVDFE
jgi:hypothetical protein